jgi:hypothetical protein
MKNMLVNFRSPVDLVSDFDEVCAVNDLSRTKTLNWLMKRHIQEQSQKARSHRNAQRIPISPDDRQRFLNYSGQYW